MANRFVNPLPQFEDSAGLPYAGAQLFFYQTGTSTKLNTYSNEALTIANTNPVVLDASGRLPNAVFLQNQRYAVVLAPATDTDPPTSPIWTQDPVYTSDVSTAAKFTSGSGSPNGVVAGTAGSTTILADSYWDFTNRILYICTTTGTTLTAVWTAINASTAAAVVPPPQGRLTLTSGVPVLPTDVTAATAAYYTPYVGNLVPIYNGATFIPTAFTEQTLSLVSSHVASNIYDVFMFNNSGVPTIGTGPSWSAGTAGSITAGSCARGTGVGGAALAYVTGVLTNAASITLRNGATTYTVNANLATYLGSLFMDGTNGQVSCLLSYGKSRKFGVWNAYNRATISMQEGDSTASWTPTGSIGPSNADATNLITSFCGLAEEEVIIEFDQKLQGSANATVQVVEIGIGVNVTNAISGKHGTVGGAVSSGSTSFRNDAKAVYNLAPTLGITNIQALDGVGTASALTAFGTSSYMVMTARYRG